jgi:hypothetical protein
MMINGWFSSLFDILMLSFGIYLRFVVCCLSFYMLVLAVGRFCFVQVTP